METVNWSVWWICIAVAIGGEITYFITKDGKLLNKLSWYTAWTALMTAGLLVIITTLF